MQVNLNLVKNMNINIENKSKNSFRQYSTIPTNKSNLKADTVSFQSRESFDSRLARARQEYIWLEWVFGAENEEIARIARQMRNEIAEVDRQIAVLKVKLDGLNQTLEDLNDTNYEISRSKKEKIKALDTTHQEYENTISQYQQQVETKDQHIKDKRANNQKLSKVLVQQQELVQRTRVSNEELRTKLQAEKAQIERTLEEELHKRKCMMQQVHAQNIEQLSKTINQAAQTKSGFISMLSKKNIKGFGRIAGYDKQKEFLINCCAAPIALEREGKPASVPNGVLFFGPKCMGKTTFAEAFASHLDCRLVKISSSLNPQKDFKAIREAAIEGQRQFEQTRKRTIILINEFDVFAPKNSPITDALKGFMDDVSKRYHCTIFVTTNYPERISDILLRDERFARISLAPADKQNAIAVLKHYCNGVTSEGINYDALAEQIVKAQPDAAFSNAQIESVVKTILPKNTVLGQRLTQGALLQSIQELGPDLTKEALAIFRTQLEYLKKL